MASFETIFLLYTKKPILGIFFYTLADRTWSEKSNGVSFRAIQHTQCPLGQCENRLRTFDHPVAGCKGLFFILHSFDRIGVVFNAA
jgi:hypothetical protein